ncbi:MAG: 1,4-dihydroxy-6-naphthoate synthase [Pontiellaceae bacterium]|nr:1,4-dihydroxy-6-naphthoate synthase [Pontiellaceae bacterium]MBN2784063.1 1,4-dihydroxy-6-naphthoate synthase [Pontiellaceae bacterium]
MSDQPLSVAYSTCPNDTFIFAHLQRDADIRTFLYDVETLNEQAFVERHDVTKLSFHAWLLLQHRYELLSAGAALGRGCGPLVICRNDAEVSLSEDSVVAVPGEYTTAHLLFRLWRPEIENRIFMPFDKIMDAVASGQADAGVIIHEGRFVYQDRGFDCLVDLGDWWESTTGQPIPLGCIAAKKRLGPQRIAEIERRLRASIQSAFGDPDSIRAYVKKHAQELDDEVIAKHIKTYVNDFTQDLGAEGRAAVEFLQKMAKDAGIID